MLTLVTGPVRAGKSRLALRLAHRSGKAPLYVATALVDPADREMTARVARHRAERGELPTVEIDERAGRTLAAVLDGADADRVLIVDSLGTWLGTELLGEEAAAERDPDGLAERLERRAAGVVDALGRTRADAVVVAEETGWGIVPAAPLARIFRDVLGRATATLARRADRAYLAAAGYALDLRALGVPIEP